MLHHGAASGRTRAVGRGREGLMLYPELQSKLRIVRKKFRKLGNRAVAAEFNRTRREDKRDQSTIGRHLRDPDPHDDKHQTELIRAICNIVNRSYEIKLSVDDFKVNDMLAFFDILKIDKFEAATYLGKKLPIPDIFLESLFQYSNSRRYVGHYLLLRDDKVKRNRHKPFIQVCVEISEDPHGLPIYKDVWDDSLGPSYTGYVFFVGTIVNIVGESRSESGVSPKPEIWWCGLQVERERGTGRMILFGYVSDIGDKIGLFTDRILLVRVAREEWDRVRDEKEFFVDRARVSSIASETMANYLEEWKDHSVRLKRATQENTAVPTDAS
jgi:hypothetical protein